MYILRDALKKVKKQEEKRGKFIMKKAALHNLGCKVNAYETEAMQEMLEDAGYEIVPFKEGADIYIINTCTVTNIADRKSRQMLHRARKMNPDAVVVAAGCYVQAKEGSQMDPCIDIVIGNNHKKDLITILREYEAAHCASASMEDINRTHEYETLHLTKPGIIRELISRYRTDAINSAHTASFRLHGEGCAAESRKM